MLKTNLEYSLVIKSDPSFAECLKQFYRVTVLACLEEGRIKYHSECATQVQGGQTELRIGRSTILWMKQSENILNVDSKM